MTRGGSFLITGVVLIALALAAMRLQPDLAAPAPYIPTHSPPLPPPPPLRPLARDIFGIVRTADGDPVPATEVEWVGWEAGELKRLAVVKTDDKGRFRFQNAVRRAAHGLTLAVFAPEYGVGMVRRGDLGDGREVRLTLRRPVRLHLSFLDPSGAPAAGLAVRISQRLPDGSWYRPPSEPERRVTDTHGALTIGPTPERSFIRVDVLDPRYAQPLILNYLATGSGPERTLRPVRLGTGEQVNGSVLDPAGRPLAGVQISVRHRPFGQLDRIFSSVTDARGRYTVRNLIPGSYWVLVDDQNEGARSRWTGAYASLTVERGESRPGPTLRPRRGYLLEGRILDRVTGEPTGGLMLSTYEILTTPTPPPTPPPSSSSIYLMRLASQPVRPATPTAEKPPQRVEVRPDGTFALCLPPGRWAVVSASDWQEWQSTIPGLLSPSPLLVNCRADRRDLRLTFEHRLFDPTPARSQMRFATPGLPTVAAP